MVVGRPSASLADKIEKDELARIDAQVKALGPEGLKKAEAELEAAKAEHEQSIPDEILNAFPVPDVKSISWIPVETVQEPGSDRQHAGFVSESSELKQYIESDGEALPFFVQYDQVEVCCLVSFKYHSTHRCIVRFCHHPCIRVLGRAPRQSTTVSVESDFT